MKKLLVTACAMLLLLAGCSDASTKVKTNETLFTVGKTNVQTSDIYSVLLPATGSNSTVSLVQTKILDDLVPVNDEIKAAADEFVKTTKESIGEGFDEQLKQAGYADVADYTAKVAIPNMQNKELSKKYINDTFAEKVEKYKPVKLQVLQFTTQEDADAVLAKAKEGGNLEELGTEYGTSSTYTGKEELYTTSSDLPTDVITKVTAEEFTEAKLHDTVISAANSSGAVSYFVVKVNAVDATTYQNEAVDAMVEISEISTESSSYYFRLNHFKVYDVIVHDAIMSTIPGLLEEPKDK